MIRGLTASLLIGLAAGCGRPQHAASPDPETAPRGPVLPRGFPREGNPCDGEETLCGPGSALLRCKAGIWEVEHQCDDACAAQGTCTAGCAVTAAGAACLCIPGSNCGERARCSTHSTLMTEDGTTVNCLVNCRKSDENTFPLGCGAPSPADDEGCLCKTLGDACDPSQSGGCVGPALEPPPLFLAFATAAIAQCIDGVWTAVSCVEVCDDPMAQCHPTGKHACSCDNS